MGCHLVVTSAPARCWPYGSSYVEKQGDIACIVYHILSFITGTVGRCSRKPWKLSAAVCVD